MPPYVVLTKAVRNGDHVLLPHGRGLPATRLMGASALVDIRSNFQRCCATGIVAQRGKRDKHHCLPFVAKKVDARMENA